MKLTEIMTNELIKAIKQLPSNKSSVLSDIPIKTIKNLGQVYSSKLTQVLNHRISSASFPNLLKYIDAIPVLNDVTDKQNNRSKIMLSNF